MARRNQAFRTSIKVFVDANLSRAAISKKVAAIARDERDRLITDGLASPKYITHVDGILGASEDNVLRNITYDFSYIGDVVEFCLDYLIANSPGPGDPYRPHPGAPHYRDSFWVAINGTPIRAASFDPTKVPSDAVCYVFNSQPYGRKVDIQFVGNQKLTFTIPANLFPRTVTKARRQFGRNISISRVYSVTLPGQWVTVKNRLVEYPALLIQNQG